MYCYKCGNPVNTGVKFCSKCGTPVIYDAPKGMGLLVFKRNYFFGFLFKIRLYVDNIKIGKLKNKSELKYEIPYGRHEITGHLPAGKATSFFIEVSPERSVQVIDCWIDVSAGITGNVKFAIVE